MCLFSLALYFLDPFFFQFSGKDAFFVSSSSPRLLLVNAFKQWRRRVALLLWSVTGDIRRLSLPKKTFFHWNGRMGARMAKQHNARGRFIVQGSRERAGRTCEICFELGTHTRSLICLDRRDYHYQTDSTSSKKGSLETNFPIFLLLYSPCSFMCSSSAAGILAGRVKSWQNWMDSRSLGLFRRFRSSDRQYVYCWMRERDAWICDIGSDPRVAKQTLVFTLISY